MSTKASVFFENLKHEKVGVIGVGVSHTDFIRLLNDKGIEVVVYDRRTAEELGDIYTEFKNRGIEMHLGPKYLYKLGGESIVFRTPGMNFNCPELRYLRNAGTIVTSELEMFFDLCPCKIIGITGSDGKTTTTTIIAKMLTEAGKTVHLGGNIGRALLPEIESVHPKDYAVVELSSFQLISMRKSPDIAIVTNISPNHLDVHKDMQEYIDAKKNIFAHQSGFSVTVLNADNAITKSFVPEVRGRVSQFSRKETVQIGAFMDRYGTIWYSDNDSLTRIMDAKDIRIPGQHNIENFMAAFSALWGIVPLDIMVKVAKEFEGVEHRIEFVREKDGVKWYNDSISTSPTRAIAGFRAFPQKVIAIAGGYDKCIPFEPLAEEVPAHVKTLILTGATADKIKKAVTENKNFDPEETEIIDASDLLDAIKIANEKAVSGDIVLFSPACASFDAFPNYKVRGRFFKDEVNKL